MEEKPLILTGIRSVTGGVGAHFISIPVFSVFQPKLIKMAPSSMLSSSTLAVPSEATHQLRLANLSHTQTKALFSLYERLSNSFQDFIDNVTLKNPQKNVNVAHKL